MKAQPDVIARSADGEAILLVQTKSRPRTSADWAAKMRRNVMAHGHYPPARYFLLATPDRFYLWEKESSSLEATSPDHSIEAGPLLGPYLAKSGVRLEEIGPESLELIVTAWLTDLLMRKPGRTAVTDAERWLEESGILEAIRGSHLERQQAA